MPLPKLRNNTLFNNSFFIFIIRFFPSLANLLVMIWYSRRLTETVYGQYQNFWVQLLVLSPFICFGIHVLLVTYSKDLVVTLVKRLTAQHYLLYGIWAVAISSVFALLQQNKLQLPVLIPFLFILSFSLTFVFESFLIVFRKFSSLAIVNVLYSVVFCFIHWRFLEDGFSMQALFTYLLLLAALRLVIYLVSAIFSFSNYKTGLQGEEPALNKIRSLWLHLGLYDVVQVLFSYIDKFIISIVLTAQVSAIYYNGSMNIPFLPLLLSAAGSAVLLQLAGGKGHDEHPESIRLMNQSGRLLSCVVFPIFFYLLFFGSELIVGLFHDKYIPAIPVFLVSVLVLPVRAYNFTTVLQRHHKGNIINAGAIADLLLACALMYPLYKWLGLPGVALSFVITTYLQAAFYLYYSARLLKTSPLKLIPYVNWVIKLIVFASLFIAIHYVCKLYISDRITLILGAVMLMAVIMISLLTELKKQGKDVGTYSQA